MTDDRRGRLTAEERLNAFRVYYNEVMHPTLFAADRERRRMLRVFGALLAVFVVVGVLTLRAQLPTLSLLLWIPIIAYASLLTYRIQLFIANFKPQVVQLILDFIEAGGDMVRFSEDSHGIAGAGRQFFYEFEDKISPDTFRESHLFTEPFTYYRGEDYVKGKVGDLDFELSELDVRKLSFVRTGYETIFRGIFFKAEFYQETYSLILILPRTSRQYLLRTIKSITHGGGYEVKINYPEFEEVFLIYSNNEIKDQQLLSPDVYQAILRYQQKTEKDIYVSFINQHIYIAITEDDNLLEPRILRSNVRFDVVRRFFEDLSLIISIIEDFDLQH